jgi:pSer/pThr/pTyr-binding forkhead associated (FHA) protein
MVQLRILTGKQAGSTHAARRFPVRIGRSASSHLRAEEDGVWNDHAELHIKPREGFFLQSIGDTLTAVNDRPLQEATLLRNGDIMQLGALRLQFWLAATRQRPLWLRESLTWLGLALISLSQIALIYLLLH